MYLTYPSQWENVPDGCLWYTSYLSQSVGERTCWLSVVYILLIPVSGRTYLMDVCGIHLTYPSQWENVPVGCLRYTSYLSQSVGERTCWLSVVYILLIPVSGRTYLLVVCGIHLTYPSRWENVPVGCLWYTSYLSQSVGERTCWLSAVYILLIPVSGRTYLMVVCGIHLTYPSRWENVPVGCLWYTSYLSQSVGERTCWLSVVYILLIPVSGRTYLLVVCGIHLTYPSRWENVPVGCLWYTSYLSQSVGERTCWLSAVYILLIPVSGRTYLMVVCGIHLTYPSQWENVPVGCLWYTSYLSQSVGERTCWLSVVYILLIPVGGRTYLLVVCGIHLTYPSQWENVPVGCLWYTSYLSQSVGERTCWLSVVYILLIPVSGRTYLLAVCGIHLTYPSQWENVPVGCLWYTSYLSQSVGERTCWLSVVYILLIPVSGRTYLLAVCGIHLTYPSQWENVPVGCLWYTSYLSQSVGERTCWLSVVYILLIPVGGRTYLLAVCGIHLTYPSQWENVPVGCLWYTSYLSQSVGERTCWLSVVYILLIPVSGRTYLLAVCGIHLTYPSRWENVPVGCLWYTSYLSQSVGERTCWLSVVYILLIPVSGRTYLLAVCGIHLTYPSQWENVPVGCLWYTSYLSQSVGERTCWLSVVYILLIPVSGRTYLLAVCGIHLTYPSQWENVPVGCLWYTSYLSQSVGERTCWLSVVYILLIPVSGRTYLLAVCGIHLTYPSQWENVPVGCLWYTSYLSQSVGERTCWLSVVYILLIPVSGRTYLLAVCGIHLTYPSQWENVPVGCLWYTSYLSQSVGERTCWLSVVYILLIPVSGRTSLMVVCGIHLTYPSQWENVPVGCLWYTSYLSQSVGERT